VFSTILVPLDGSPFSEHALPPALALATRGSGRLHLVTVATAEPGSGGAPSSSVDAVPETDRMTPAAEEYLSRVEGRIRERGAPVEITHHALPAGNVAASLLREMQDHPADLAVMTTHGRGALQRAWLGSVADALVRQAPIPLLLIRPGDGAVSGDPDPLAGDPPRFLHVLVPLDGSEAAAEALGHGVALANSEGGRLTLLRVLPPVVAGGAYPYVAVPAREDEAATDLARRAREELESVAADLRGQGTQTEVVLKRVNQPAAAILDFADEEQVDVVAMTTRGRGGVARLVLGSVADKVIRGADVPVLVHHPRVGESPTG
jgi:nucleotide-binding universal stress UspA family protein